MIKGALHIHSNVSPDSKLSLAFLKELFKKTGYDFILLTEHAENLNYDSYEKLKQECLTLSDQTFLIVPGLEIKWRDTVHLLAYGARNYRGNEAMNSFENTVKSIREVTECGLLVWGHVNHPVRLDKMLLDKADLVDGIEVFNSAYHGFILPEAGGLVVMDRLKKKNPNILAMGGLDMHERSNYDKITYILPGMDMIDRDKIFYHLGNGEYICRGKVFTLRQNKGSYSIFLKITAWFINKVTMFIKKVRNRIKRG